MIKQLVILLGLVAVGSALNCGTGNSPLGVLGTVTAGTDCTGVTIAPRGSPNEDPNNSNNAIAHCHYPAFVDYQDKYSTKGFGCGKCAANDATCKDCNTANCNTKAEAEKQPKSFKCYKYKWDEKWIQEKEKTDCKASTIRCFRPGKGAKVEADFNAFKAGCGDVAGCTKAYSSLVDADKCGTCDKTECNGAASVVFSSILAIAAFILHFA